MIDKDVIRRRLLARVQRDPLTKCWIFTGCWNRKGQARMKVGCQVYRIQAVAAWVFRGIELWDDVVRYRTCKTPACCNPAHIKVASTIAEALNEMRRRRLFSIEGHRKLRPAQKRCIKFLVAKGITVGMIASDLGMNPTTIRRAACA